MGQLPWRIISRLRIATFSLALLLLIAFGSSAHAVQPDEILANPQLESRARAIGQDLRCLVCQNQSIDDSDADLARDLRLLVRQRLTAGDSDTQVKDYIVARYGDYVLLNPPLKTTTLALWFAPPLFAGAAFALWLATCKRRPPTEPAPLSPQEQQKLQALLDNRKEQP